MQDKPKEIRVDFPKELLGGVYSNNMAVSHTGEEFIMDFIEKNTIKGYADGVKVDFLAHKYPLINKTLEIENLRIASIDDISAMKVNSVANDGTRVKDFIGLYQNYHLKLAGQ